MLIEEQLQLPRLTGTLRAFSSVSKRYEELDSAAEKNLIIKKRKQVDSNSQADDLVELNWPTLVAKLIPVASDAKYSKLKSLLDKLRTNIAKQFLNEDFNDATLLNEASLYLVESFYDHFNPSQLNFLNSDKLAKKLKEKFGQFQRNLFDQCRDLFESLFGEIANLDRLACLNDLFKGKKVKVLDEAPIQVGSYFGENIKFYSFYDDDKFKNTMGIYTSGEESESDEETNEPVHFAFPVDSTKEMSQTATAASSVVQDDELKYIEWTQTLDPDLARIIYETLAKKTNTNDIQNELAELLGFDKLELVEYLLGNRESVVNAYKLYITDLNAVKMRKNASLGSMTAKKPTIASEIVVHTETEKRIKKQIQKEEKRLNKLKSSNNQLLGDESDESFDPSVLRKIREEQLREARLFQLYSQKKMESLTLDSVNKQTDQYPYVFDSLLKIQQTSAYVAGSKILLPETVVRYDTKAYEEIHIPPVDSISTANPDAFRGSKEEICLRPFVKIQQLDEIGQIAFRNVKSLNRIQSIVFDVAYNTNQNLLICAPTGAGKTNIAMLAVVNQIRKHFDAGGVLRKDEFKIVYIAPMKALAAEMVENFSKRLEPLGIVVKELTGDIQLTKQEILDTQMLVTTPEKWDVVTRKSLGDISLSLLVKLLIIDEVHLLHDDRGSVIETIVARTLRQGMFD